MTERALTAWRWLGFIVALALLQAVLTLPPNVLTAAPGETAYGEALIVPALELAVLVALLAFSPPPLRRAVRVVAAVLLALLVFLKLADAGFDLAFDRRFDPALDFYLLPAGWTLLEGSIGKLRATAAVGGVVVAYAVVILILHWALGRLSAMSRSWSTRAGAFVAAAAFTVLAFTPGARGPAPAATLAAEHVRTSAASLSDTVGFRTGLAHDPFAEVPSQALLSALKGKDVVLVFVESYGRSALEDPRYAGAVGRGLDAVQRDLDAAGFQARSSWLMSPTFGGQSWLAHETLLSGLWITGAGRYAELVGSKRATLIGDFRRAGWRTIAVAPAITEPWPEAKFFGYDQVYDARGLGYRGLPFNWITMPDQYTLSALQRLELGRKDRPPVMAQVALISSHAPFVPVPTLVDWNAVGDGRVFNRMVEDSEPADSVWADLRRVQAAYAESIAYSLTSLSGYVKRYADDRLVMIVLGDHQPGNVVAPSGASHEVPIHIFAKDPKVLAAIDRWDWARGLRPGPGPSKWRMDGFRAELLTAFTPAGDLPRSRRP